MFVAIVAINRKGIIGKDGVMPWHNKEDLQHFRDTTYHQKIIMGRTTYENLPKSLENRDVYIVSRSLSGVKEQVIPDFERFLQEHEKDSELYYMAGGRTIYAQALPYTQKILVSRLDNDVDGDTYFPAIDPDVFELTATKPYTSFTLEIYERK